MPLTTITDETRLALATFAERTIGVTAPAIRLGVTGLARAGKTVFISALVHNLIHGGRLPLFRAYSGGRVLGARLEPQPDDAVPRFEYETPCRGPGRRTDLARFDAPDQRVAADDPVRIGLLADAHARPRQDAYRYRRLSRRVAPRPAPPVEGLRHMVARGTGLRPRSRSDGSRQAVARRDRRRSIPRRRKTSRSPGDWRRPSPTICAPPGRKAAASRPCRRAAS